MEQGTDSVPVTEQLRVLVVTANPLDLPDQLNVEQELKDIKDVLEGSLAHVLIELEQLKMPCTLESLQQRLRKLDQPIHILHFIGHGQYDTGQNEGVLFFETKDRQSRRVTAERLTSVLRDHKSLRLIFLNSCEGATNGANSIFSGLAQQIVSGMPSTLLAVVAMQSLITDQAAISLTRNFYEAIAYGYPVDAALAEARKAVYASGSDFDWGTPALFMRARNSTLFHIPQSAQYPGFQLLNINDLKKNEGKIALQVSTKLLKLVHDNRLIVLSDEPQATLQALAYHLAYKLNTADPGLSILEWQNESEQLDFEFLFPLVEKFNRAPDKTIFIIPELSDDLFASHFLPDLALWLAGRDQYLILTVAASRNILELRKTTTKFWAEPEKIIYDTKFLLTQLEQGLQKNEDRLPQHLLDRLKSGQLGQGYSLRKIAIQLRLPIHIDIFVEHLCNHDGQITKEYIQELIQNIRAESDEDRIKYLYSHLPQRSDQLLVVGLCLFGCITETQFFQLLERVIKNCWQYAFIEVEILDYYHLHKLHQFFKYHEQEPKQYPVERTLLPQYTHQWWHLLLIIWESHRNHVRKTFFELAAITVDSTSPQYEDYGNERQRQRLRNALGTLFSNVGRIALPSIEDTLFDLASHRHRSVQAVVADAIARWYDKNEKVDARNQLFKLLERWLSCDWSLESNWKSHQRHQQYVRFTIARTLNQVLDKVSDPLPDPLPDLLLKVLQSPSSVQKFFRTNISRKIFPHHTPYIIDCWRQTWEKSTKAEVAVELVDVMGIIAPLCKRHNQLQLIALWLVDILAYGVKQQGNDVITLLQNNLYLIKAVFPPHLSKLNDDGTLLYLVRCGGFEREILDVLVEVYQVNHQAVQTIAEQWWQQWISYHDQISEIDDQGWYNVLTLIGKFYEDIRQFIRFQTWLPRLVEEEDTNTQSQIVEVLYRVDQHQRKKLANTLLGGLDPILIPTGAKEIADAWLSDGQKGAAFHLMGFWFSAKLLGEIDRRSMHRKVQPSFYLKKLIPFLASPFNRRCRVIVGNLLPVVDGLFQDKPEEVDRIINAWRKNPNKPVQQVARRLQWALHVCKVGRMLQSVFSRILRSK